MFIDSETGLTNQIAVIKNILGVVWIYPFNEIK